MNKKKKRTQRRQRNIPELLAPAGTMEAFSAALEAGADAVYVSPQILNARAYGKNFSVEQIANLTQTAHSKKVKLFVALNSVMKEEEIPQCVLLLSQLQEIGVDALIIQDLGILRLAKRHFPKLRLHASTLMTVHNSLGIEICRRLGFSRVVLARELTLKEIAHIAVRSSMELEVFIHGAMCFSISGLCRFSSFHGGKSSIRGRCVQPCRRIYKWNGKKGTFFSMGDLCALELIPALANIGVNSLKIEGRLRPANYVYHVVKAYRTILDADGRDRKKALSVAVDHIDKSMGRPLSKGFYLSSNPKDLICPTRTANTGMFIGKIITYKNGTIQVGGKKNITKGDRIRIVLKDNDRQFSARVESATPRGLLKIRPETVPEDMKNTLTGALVFKFDTKELENRNRQPSTLHKSRHRNYHDKAYIKAKKVISQLKPPPNQRKNKITEPSVTIFLNDFSKLQNYATKHTKISFLFILSKKNLDSASRMSVNTCIKRKITWHLPPVCFEYQLSSLESLIKRARDMGFSRFQISNLGHLALPFKGARLTSSYELNILNSQALKLLKEIGIERPQFSIETDMKNIKETSKHYGQEISMTVYGHFPLFTTRLRHKIYDTKSPVQSQRGELFFWRQDKDLGYLVSKTPLSFLDLGNGLLEIGATNWIIDLRDPYGKKTKRFRLPSSWKGFRRLLRGKKFNLSSLLQ